MICAKRLPHNPFTKLYMYYKNITSRVIVTDDYNRYLRHFQLRQSRRVVQLWHAAVRLRNSDSGEPTCRLLRIMLIMCSTIW